MTPTPDDCNHHRTAPLPDGGWECMSCGQEFNPPNRKLTTNTEPKMEGWRRHLAAARERVQQAKAAK